MRRLFWLLCLPLAAASPPAAADASAGIFAILDEVELEPTARDPDRIRLRGVFTLPQRSSSGLHQAPRAGELYFSLNPDYPEQTRADWQALSAAAGTGEVVAFAEYWMPAERDSFLKNLPAPRGENVSMNTSLVVTLHDYTAAVVPEPYPRPNREGVLTRFDSEAQLCPRFGPPSSEIIAQLWAAHAPDRERPALPVCAARAGLVDNDRLDAVFATQTRDAGWADAAEALLSERIAGSGVRLTQLSIECRETICHLEFAYPSVDYQRATGNALTGAALEDLPGFAPGAKFEPSLAGQPTLGYWIQRQRAE